MDFLILTAFYLLTAMACTPGPGEPTGSAEPAGPAGHSVPAGSDPIADARQLVVVVSPDKSSVRSKMWRFSKEGTNWKQVGTAHEAVLGRTGLAWGRGLHDQQPGQQKKEGDGKSPAGIFRLGPAFGYASPKDVSMKMDYLQLTSEQLCVEDGRSKFYNQIVNKTAVEKDWESTEAMRREDDLYKWGLFVSHNVPPKPGDGSCIFFHLWRAPGSATLGCTGMTEEHLLALLHWLDPTEGPLLVQVTQGDYAAFKARYKLPGLE